MYLPHGKVVLSLILYSKAPLPLKKKMVCDWTLLKETDPARYEEIRKKQYENRKAVMDKKYADPVWRANFIKKQREGQKRRRLLEGLLEAQTKQKELDVWKDVEDWVKEIEKTLVKRKEALEKLRPFVYLWRKVFKAFKSKQRVDEQQEKFKQAHPDYQKEWHAKQGGNAAIKKKRQYKKDNKEAAQKHLEITEMTELERRRFRYDNMLDSKVERTWFRNWARKNNETLERTPFLEFKDEPEPPKKRGPKPTECFRAWVEVHKPERQMTLEEMGQAAGGPINWVPDSHQTVDIPTSEWDD